MSGRLITLEGGEGAGKTTQAVFVRDWLQQRGRAVVQTREPGGSPLAEAIRNVVLDDWAEGVNTQTETLLMFAARAAHLHSLILPALQNDQDVVCDRFVDASWAYQGAGRGVDPQTLSALEGFVLKGLQPHLTLLLDLPPDVALERVAARHGNNRFEREHVSFVENVRAAYLNRARQSPDRFAVIDASVGVEPVRQAIAAVLEQRL
ncbi:MAG: dTMP kinase [Panacagrimonas sp.]